MDTQQQHQQSTLAATAAAVVDPKAVDDLLSQELKQLSFQDRSAIHEEIHGVRSMSPEETPELIELSLISLEIAIQKIAMKRGYELAQSLLPHSYVNDRSFLLRFLRCELFDVKKAAIRMCNYLDFVLDVKGQDALQQLPCLSDLSQKELEYLKQGYIQLLPYRDRSGRRIIVLVDNFGLKTDYDIRGNVYLYLFTRVTDDIETQRKGVVFLLWPGPADVQFTFPDRQEHILGNRAFASLPMRITCIHCCFRENPIYRVVRAVSILMMGRNKARTMFHTGGDLEMRYTVMSFGIPVDLVPLTETGKIKTKNLLQWIKIRKVLDSSPTTPSSPVECPFSSDVVFRFGQSNMEHPGNVVFRGLLETYYDQHKEAKTQNDKMTVTWRVVEELEKRNGRFLTWDSRGWWVPVLDRAQVRQKVAVCLKDHTRRLNALKNQQTSRSSTSKFEQQDARKRKRGGYQGDDNTDAQCCS